MWWIASSLTSLLDWQLTEKRLGCWTWHHAVGRRAAGSSPDHSLHAPVCNPLCDLHPMSNWCVFLCFTNKARSYLNPCFFLFAYSVFNLFCQLQVFFWVFLFIPIGLSELDFSITEFSFAWNMYLGLGSSNNSFIYFKLISIFVYLEDPENNWIGSASVSLSVKVRTNIFNSVYS